MKHVYDIIHDEASSSKILKQSKNLSNIKSIKADGLLRHRVFTIVDKVLHHNDITIIKSFYGDVFTSSELLRFKAVVPAIQNYKDVMNELSEQLLIDFKIKQLSYINEDGNVPMILIWL